MKGYRAVNCTDVGKQLSANRQVTFVWTQVAFWHIRVGLSVCVWVHIPTHTCLPKVRRCLCEPCLLVSWSLSQLSTFLPKKDACFPTGHLHPHCLFVSRKHEPAVCVPAIDAGESSDTAAVRGPAKPWSYHTLLVRRQVPPQGGWDPHCYLTMS